MDKQMYKQLVADYMRREAKLQNQIKSLKEQILELHMENAELKDEVLNNGGEYAETDGYEVGSPSDYEEDKQLNIFESPDGGETIYQRTIGDTDRVLVKSPDDNPNQLNLFND